MRTALVLALVTSVTSVAACGKKHSACGEAVGHVVELSAGKETRPAVERGVGFEKLADKIIDTCERDGWAPEVVDCFKNAVDIVAVDACERRLTRAQRKAAYAVGEDTDPAADEAIQRITDLRDRMCACIDAACAAAVAADWKALEREPALQDPYARRKFDVIDAERRACQDNVGRRR